MLPRISAAAILRKARNQLVRLRSEAALWRIGRQAGRKRPRVLFFLSGEGEAAGLLRGQYVADALGRYGWIAATVPAMVNRSGRARIIRRFRPDLLVFQQCRHILNDGDLSFGVPYVLDSDDADFHLQIPGLADRLERTARGARGVIAGSRYLQDHYRRLNSNVAVIWTGTRISDEAWPSHVERAAEGPPILTWAQARPLDYTRELDFVIDLERRLRAAGSLHRLRFYGLDTEAERTALARRFGPETDLELLPTLDYDPFLASLREVAVGLCPLIADSPFSRGKSFGKILGYLHAGVPVVASDAADHAVFFTPDAGVVSNDLAVWEAAVRTLLADPKARDAMATRADALFRERLSIEAAARLTDRFLRELIAASQRLD